MNPLGPDSSVLSAMACGGKLPSMGDFVWHSPNSEARTTLDTWLQASMHQFRLSYNEQWQNLFDAAPLWNFILPPGGLSHDIVVGCISPSCDRVGRRFPFVVTFAVRRSLPPRVLADVIHATPTLLSHTGILLFNGIRRKWPMETLVSLIQQGVNDWRYAFSTTHGPLALETIDSDILSVLLHKDDMTGGEAATLPNDRFSTLPWTDVASSLKSDYAMSFWWTNGAGNASLKAFTYNAHLDGALLSWLFGRPAN